MQNEKRPTETTITVAGLRQLCGAAQGEIEALVRARLLTARAGKVPLVAGIRAYLDGIRAATKSASLVAAQDAAKVARADAAELALAVDDRRLVKQVEAEEAVAAICGAIMSRTFTISARVTRDVRERRKIEDALRGLQADIAKAVAGIDDPAEAAKPTARRRTK